MSTKADRQDERIAKQYKPEHTPTLPFKEKIVSTPREAFRQRLSGHINKLRVLRDEARMADKPGSKISPFAYYPAMRKQKGRINEAVQNRPSVGKKGNPNHDAQGRFS